MRGVHLLHLTRLRQQPVRAMLTVIVVAAGVTLLAAVAISQASIGRALDGFHQHRAGPAKLEIRGPSQPGGLHETTLPQVVGIDGVAAAVPLVKAVTVAVDEAGDETLIIAMGVDCRIEALLGRIGCADLGLAEGGNLQESGAGSGRVDRAGQAGDPMVTPVLSTSLHDALGGEGVIRSDRGRVPIADAAALERLDDLNQGDVALFPLSTAQALFSRERAYDSILVIPAPGVDTTELQTRLQSDALGEHIQVLSSGESRRRDNPQELVLVLIGLLAVGLGAGLAHSALSLSLEERRRELCVAGALGAPRRALLMGTMVEAGVLGLAGGLLGLAGGIALTRPLSASLTSYAARVTGVTHVDITVPGTAVATAVGLGLAVALFAAVRPAWRAARADLSAELRASEVGDVEAPHRYRWAVAFAVAGLAGMATAWLGQRDGALQPWQPPLALAGVAATIFFLLGTTVHTAAPLLGAITTRLRMVSRGLGRLAADNLVAQPRRTGILTLVVATAVAVGVILGSVQRSIPHAVSAELGNVEQETVRVTTLPTLNFDALATRLDPASRARLGEISGVAGVIEHYGVVLEHPALGSGEVGVTTRHPEFLARHPVVAGDPVDATIQRGEALIGPALARDLGLRPGDTFEVPGRHGMVPLRVGTVWADGEFAGRSLALGYDRFEEIWGPHAPRHLHVIPDAETSPATLATRIWSELSTVDPDLRALAPDAVVRDVTAEVQVNLTPFWALQRGLIGVAVLATTLTLLLVGVQRRREYSMLAAIGLAPARLGRMLLVEAGLIGLVGTLLGTLVGLAGTIVFGFAAPLVTGWGIPFQLDATAPVLYGLLTTVCIVIGSGLPAWRAARLDPSSSLRFE
jgi:putative ABC transport system permease protein